MNTKIQLAVGVFMLAFAAPMASEIKATPQVQDQFVNPIRGRCRSLGGSGSKRRALSVVFSLRQSRYFGSYQRLAHFAG